MQTWIYGRNAVSEAVLNHHEVSELIYVSRLDPRLEKEALKQHAEVRQVSKEELQRYVGAVAHQGIAALIKSYEYMDLEVLIGSLEDKEDSLVVLLDGLEDPHNLGAILRCVDGAGGDGVIIGKHRSVSLNSTVAKVSTGAIEYVPVCQVTNLTQTIGKLKSAGFWIYGTSQEGGLNYLEADYKRKICLVIGAEGFGISRLVAKSCDLLLTIPMRGHVNSLNAAVACGVLLYGIQAARG